MPWIEEVRTLAELEKLQAEWEELQATAGAPSIFLTHQWFLVCAQNLPADQRMLILLVREGKRLVGIAPLIEERRRIRGLPVTQIGCLQSRLSPFTDFLLIDPQEGLSAVLGHLWNTRRNWDVLRLSGLREDSPLLELLCSMLRAQRRAFRKCVISQSPFLLIQQSWEEFYQSKSQKFKKTRRSVSNRISRLGEITVEQVNRPEDAARGLEQMLAVSAGSWKQRQHIDLLTPQFEHDFFSDLTRVASEAGWLRLWLLKKGEEVLAAEFHLDDHGTIYALRAQYDDAHASYSPGTYLDFQIVQHLFGNGYSCYDMGPGAADYKLAWTSATRACYAVEVYNCGFYPKLLNQLQNSWIPRLKATSLGRWILRDQEPRRFPTDTFAVTWF